MSVPWVDDVGEDKVLFVGGETGCRSTPPLSAQGVWPVVGLGGRGNDSRLSEATSSPYSSCGEILTENRERNTNREPEVEPVTARVTAPGVEETPTDYSGTVVLVRR